MGEKLSIVGDVPKPLQDCPEPELGELKAQSHALSDRKKSLETVMQKGFRSQVDQRPEMEARFLREIKISEEKRLLRIQPAKVNLELGEKTHLSEGALRKNETLRREKAQ